MKNTKELLIILRDWMQENCIGSRKEEPSMYKNKLHYPFMCDCALALKTKGLITYHEHEKLDTFIKSNRPANVRLTGIAWWDWAEKQKRIDWLNKKINLKRFNK